MSAPPYTTGWLADHLGGTLDGAADVAIAAGAVERAPEEDAPWILDGLFRASRERVDVAVACELLTPEWWRGQMAAAARRTPGRPWRLRARPAGARRARTFEG